MLHVVDDAAVVLEHLVLLAALALVAELDLEALVQVGHHLEALGHGLGAELDLVEDRRVRPERHDRARGPGLRRRSDHLERAVGAPAVAERHLVALAAAVDLQDEPGGERVHDRGAHTVQAPGDLVARAAELPARVQHRVHDLCGGQVGVLGVWLGGDPAPVVLDAAAAVLQQGDVDAGAVPGHRLVHGVVHDLADEVVQARRAGRADVHARADPDRIQPLEHRDVAGPVGVGPLCLLRHEGPSVRRVAARAGACDGRPAGLGGRLQSYPIALTFEALRGPSSDRCEGPSEDALVEALEALGSVT